MARGNRSVIELMVLSFTLIVGISIISLGATVVFVKITNPDTDVERLVATLSSLVSSILGALLGLIAGRAATSDLHRRPTGDNDGLNPEDEVD